MSGRPLRVPVIIAGVALTLALVAASAVGIGRAGPALALGAPQFVDEGVQAGLAFTFDGSSTFQVGGGVAVLDCDDDGRPDLFLAGGERPAGLFRNASQVGGALKFEHLADASTDLTGVMGAYPLDIDGDGHVDLAVLRVGGNFLLRGLGDCRFERANEAWSFGGGVAATTAFSATWEGDAQLPTLAFGNYLDPASNDSNPVCSNNELVRPAPVARQYSAPTPLVPSYCALSMLFSDWDRSGRRDLRVSNDAHYYDPADGEEQLWRIMPGEPPRLYTADEGWVRVQLEGMGIASYDLTKDGYPEVFLTSQADNKLQTLASGPDRPTYRNIGFQRGVNVAHPFSGDVGLPSTAWHPEFADVNDDGFVDLFVSKGNVGSQADYALRDPSNLLLGQPDGTFVEAADRAGVLSFDRGRGAALADFNLDGRLDLVESNYGAPVRLWRNTGTGPAAGHFLELRLQQTGPNRDAIGAWVEVRVGDAIQQRELTVGGGHSGGQLGWLHFGLGTATDADVRVQWPNGETGPWQHVKANGFAILDRGTDAPQVWTPPSR
jgi:hypothetical protein